MIYKIEEKNREISRFQLTHHSNDCLSCNTREDWEFFVWGETSDALSKDLQSFFDRDDVVFTSWVDGLYYLPTWEIVQGYSRNKSIVGDNNKNQNGKLSKILNFFKRR